VAGMKNLIGLLTILGLMAAMFYSCEKPESYSEIPEIEFKSFRVYDTTKSGFNQRQIAISFKFVDGDGDIGYRLGVDDTTKKDNLFFSKYAQIGGSYVNIDSLLVVPNVFSLPYEDVMERSGQNKTMKGTIKVDLQELLVKYDSIKYDFYIVDRAGNKSNVATTTEITGLKEKVILPRAQIIYNH
jgi:hypothetical protein